MGIDHSGLNILVPKQLLNRADVIPALQQMSRKAVPEGVTANLLTEPYSPCRLFNCFLHSTFMQVMSAH